jgi:hypothetical protein
VQLRHWKLLIRNERNNLTKNYIPGFTARGKGWDDSIFATPYSLTFFKEILRRLVAANNPKIGKTLDN